MMTRTGPGTGDSTRRTAWTLLVGRSLVGVATVASVLVAGLSDPMGTLTRPHLAAAAAAVLMAGTGPALGNLDHGGEASSDTWLVVATDRRQGVGRLPPDVGWLDGARADSIVLVLVDPADVRLVAVPRDLLVSSGGYGEQRISGFLRYGAEAMVDAVRDVARTPIHHYVEVDMGALLVLVEAAGGVELVFPNPSRDRTTGLEVRAGVQRLNGEQALAYARSRRFETYVEGSWGWDAADDRGRIDRQSQLVSAIGRRVNQIVAHPLRTASTAWSLRRHVSVDRGTSAADLVGLQRALVRAPLRLDVVPTVRQVPLDESYSPFPPAHVGTTGAVVLDQPDARDFLGHLRTRTGVRG